MTAPTLLLATLLLTGSATATIDATASAHEHYPLRIGNSWTYVSTMRGEFTNSVVDTTRTDGELWYRIASMDLEVRPTIAGVRDGRDEVLDAAVSRALGRAWRMPGDAGS
jgi:hypothetical protein